MYNFDEQATGVTGARARLAMTLSTFNKPKGKNKGPAKKK